MSTPTSRNLHIHHGIFTYNTDLWDTCILLHQEFGLRWEHIVLKLKTSLQWLIINKSQSYQWRLVTASIVSHSNTWYHHVWQLCEVCGWYHSITAGITCIIIKTITKTYLVTGTLQSSVTRISRLTSYASYPKIGWKIDKGNI